MTGLALFIAVLFAVCQINLATVVKAEQEQPGIKNLAVNSVGSQLMTKYKSKIDTLAADITTHYNVAKSTIQSVQTDVTRNTTQVVKSADLEIQSAKSEISLRLQRPNVAASSSAKLCCTNSQIVVNALKSSIINECIPSANYSDWNDQAGYIQTLSSLVNGLCSGCSKLYPAASQTEAAEECITNCLTVIENLATTSFTYIQTNSNSVVDKYNDCISEKVTLIEGTAANMVYRCNSGCPKTQN